MFTGSLYKFNWEFVDTFFLFIRMYFFSLPSEATCDFTLLVYSSPHRLWESREPKCVKRSSLRAERSRQRRDWKKHAFRPLSFAKPMENSARLPLAIPVSRITVVLKELNRVSSLKTWSLSPLWWYVEVRLSSWKRWLVSIHLPTFRTKFSFSLSGALQTLRANFPVTRTPVLQSPLNVTYLLLNLLLSMDRKTHILF